MTNAARRFASDPADCRLDRGSRRLWTSLHREPVRRRDDGPTRQCGEARWRTAAASTCLVDDAHSGWPAPLAKVLR